MTITIKKTFKGEEYYFYLKVDLIDGNHRFRAFMDDNDQPAKISEDCKYVTVEKPYTLESYGTPPLYNDRIKKPFNRFKIPKWRVNTIRNELNDYESYKNERNKRNKSSQKSV